MGDGGGSDDNVCGGERGFTESSPWNMESLIETYMCVENNECFPKYFQNRFSCFYNVLFDVL